jgi:hypothetical protein
MAENKKTTAARTKLTDHRPTLNKRNHSRRRRCIDNTIGISFLL